MLSRSSVKMACAIEEQNDTKLILSVAATYHLLGRAPGRAPSRMTPADPEQRYFVLSGVLCEPSRRMSLSTRRGADAAGGRPPKPGGNIMARRDRCSRASETFEPLSDSSYEHALCRRSGERDAQSKTMQRGAAVPPG